MKWPVSNLRMESMAWPSPLMGRNRILMMRVIWPSDPGSWMQQAVPDGCVSTGMFLMWRNWSLRKLMCFSAAVNLSKFPPQRSPMTFWPMSPGLSLMLTLSPWFCLPLQRGSRALPFLFSSPRGLLPAALLQPLCPLNCLIWLWSTPCPPTWEDRGTGPGVHLGCPGGETGAVVEGGVWCVMQAADWHGMASWNQRGWVGVQPRGWVVVTLLSPWPFWAPIVSSLRWDSSTCPSGFLEGFDEGMSVKQLADSWHPTVG